MPLDALGLDSVKLVAAPDRRVPADVATLSADTLRFGGSVTSRGATSRLQMAAAIHANTKNFHIKETNETDRRNIMPSHSDTRKSKRLSHQQGL